MENDWDVVRNDRGWPSGSAGMGMLRITLLFGSAAVALALIIAPIAERQTRSYLARSGMPDGIDDDDDGQHRQHRLPRRIHDPPRACCNRRRKRSA